MKVKIFDRPLVCVSEIAQRIGIDRGTARELIAGLEFIPIGKKKLYSAEDVTARLMERRKI